MQYSEDDWNTAENLVYLYLGVFSKELFEEYRLEGSYTKALQLLGDALEKKPESNISVVEIENHRKLLDRLNANVESLGKH